MIEIKNLTKTFGRIVALNNVSLELTRGRMLALIGPSAAGKTVLLKCLVGLYAAQKGVLKIDGTRIGIAARRSTQMQGRVGMLFQKNALFDSLSVWENVAFRQSFGGDEKMGRARAYQMAVDLLKQVGLDEHAARLYPSDLSGGMQKRVGFARAIASEPDILLLDNPTAGLDPILAGRIMTMITDLVKARGASAIVVTGEMRELTQHYDDIAVLHEGHLRWHGTSKAAQKSDNPWLHQLLTGSRAGPIKPQISTSPNMVASAA